MTNLHRNSDLVESGVDEYAQTKEEVKKVKAEKNPAKEKK